MYTLITGACKGIGKALAYECAERGLNLLLVSNDHDCLEVVCENIRATKNVKSHCFTADLTKEDGPAKIYEWVKINNFRVNMLINNAGIGKGGLFENINMKDINYMLMLNNKAVVELTYLFIPELKQTSKSYILNISSLEATLPLPYKAVYTATKNFVYAFSLSIAQELKFTNIHVSVLCPGPVLTNKEGLSRMSAHGSRSKLLMMHPEPVAKIAIGGLLKEKLVIVPGRLNSFFFKLGSLIPTRLKMNLLERLFRVYK